MNRLTQKKIRTRFAPSPTGFLHLGGARTALFNWLFAKFYGGKFILRVEDTDVERSNPEYERDIIESLKWLDLIWDEGPAADAKKYVGDYGPYKQSERSDIYEKYLKRLLNEEKAYYCFCPKEELEAERQAMLSQGLPPKYGGKCRRLPKNESEKRLARGDKAVIRFKMPEREVEFNDLIRGRIKFDAALIGDIVIAKNLKSPLFNFAVTVDDYEMKISHVIRGEDHLSNTPKQILIAEALGFETPEYAHLPLILAPDRSKMSKRYMETSVSEYKKQGYLAEAIVNFLALLGWRSAKEPDREMFSLKELTEEFDVKKIQKSGAVFNVEKFEWLNAAYIRKTDSIRLAERLKDFIPRKWFDDKDILIKAVHIEKNRMRRLADFKELADFFFELPDYDASILRWKEMTPDNIKNNLSLLKEKIGEMGEKEFNFENLEKEIMPLAKKHGSGETLWPLRTALSGKKASPGPFEIMEVIGKKETLKRIAAAIEKI